MVLAESKGRILSAKVCSVLPCKKTATVYVTTLFKHSKYGKVINKCSKFIVDTNGGDYSVDDKVFIQETPPISKKKSWVILRRM